MIALSRGKLERGCDITLLHGFVWTIACEVNGKTHGGRALA
jgi:hypothetical protein